MFLIEKINLEEELKRQANYLKIIEQKLGVNRDELQVELKILTMLKINELNRLLLTKSNIK